VPPKSKSIIVFILKEQHQTQVFFNSPETAVDSTALAPSSPNGWHDIDNFPETAPRLPAEQEALMSYFLRPYNPSSRLSSELLHDRIDIEASIRVTIDPRPQYAILLALKSPPPRYSRTSPENQLSQEDHPYTSQSTVDEHEPGLVCPTLNTDTFDKEKRQEAEAEDEDKDEDDEQRQEVDGVAAIVTAKGLVTPIIPARRMEA